MPSISSIPAERPDFRKESSSPITASSTTGTSSGKGWVFPKKTGLCIPVPFYHCFGMVLSNLACMTHGSTMVIPCPVFNAEEVLKTVQEERCTALNGVPTMFIAELAHPDFPHYSMKHRSGPGSWPVPPARSR